MTTSATDPECLIVGGGPAGLTAAIYLSRFRRRVLLADAGQSRAALIPRSRNYPGFADGVSGRDLLLRLQEQAGRYGAVLRKGTVEELAGKDGAFRARVDGEEIVAAKVLIAAGIVDEKPALPSLSEFIYSGAVRFCPICDGFEATDKRIGIVGPLDQVARKAHFLRSYSRDLVLLATDTTLPDAECARLLRDAGLAPPAAPVVDLVIEGEAVTAVMPDGEHIELDILYPAMGARVRSDLAQALGAQTNALGCVVTDDRQRTNVPGLYAAGDLTVELAQISVATGQAAIAATDIHKSLPLNAR